MKHLFDNALTNVKNVEDVRVAVLSLLKSSRESSDKLGFVSGIIFSDGLEFKARNLRRLSAYTDKLCLQNDFPIFSGIDIFYSGLYEKLPEGTLPYDERRVIFFKFWKDIVSSGYITDIFMTPRWKVSEGSRDEHTNAQKLGLNIHYIESDDTISNL